MEKKIRKPWSDETRARKDFCIAWGLAREIGVEVKPLLKTLIATNKATLHKMSEIEPREERLRAFKNLVVDYCQGVTA
ncbi:MAG: hypothetical protein NTY86_16245 [Deltaproteobacteria bacterium]|nr:hypothetical protein [Deltaproteobacteria bacterium]